MGDSEVSGSWYSTAEAADVLGYAPRTLSRLAREGHLKRQRVGGNWRFDKDQVDRLAQIPDQAIQDQVEYIEEDTLLKQAHEFVRAMVGPARALSDSLQAENAALRKRCAELERLQTELLTAREEALDRRHERELEVGTLAKKEERKQLALQQLLALVPDAMNSIVPALKLVKSLTPEQRVVLQEAESAFLTDEQRKLLSQVLDKEKEQKTNGQARHQS